MLQLFFFFIVIVPSAIMHEYAHGWMADRLGDPTAKYAGRLTLDPRAHIDLFGTIILPLIMLPTGFLFAYAKPVPFNPYNLRDQKWGPVWVAAAGPASNLVIAAFFGLLFQFLPASNISIFLYIIVFANVLLAVFNMVPIPPLDGSKFLLAVLPDSMHQVKVNLQRYGMFILLAFLFFGLPIIHPIISFFTSLFTGGVSLY